MYIVFIIMISILIGYIIGLLIVSVVQTHLQKNMPIESFENTRLQSVQPDVLIPSKIESKIESKEYVTLFDKEYYDQMQKDSTVNGFIAEQTFNTWKIEPKQTHVCIKNHIHDKNRKDTNCTYGVTNYADPKDMSSMDYSIFQLNYPANMTLQDYINWLYCYQHKEDQLPYNHLKNLEKLKKGIPLIEEHGVLPPPGYYYPTLTAESYFEKMYNETNEFSIASPLNSQTGPMVGYNYKDYSEFSQNIDVKGTSGTIRNTDIAIKKNAKELYDFVQPKDSTQLNMDKENEIYRIKKIEI